MKKRVNKWQKVRQSKTYAELKENIEEALMLVTIVEDDEAAEMWFTASGIDEGVTYNVIFSEYVNVWNEDENGEERYLVKVFEYYSDAGSEDYVYSYTIE